MIDGPFHFSGANKAWRRYLASEAHATAVKRAEANRAILIEEGAFAAGWDARGEYVADRRSQNHVDNGRGCLVMALAMASLLIGASLIGFAMDGHFFDYVPRVWVTVAGVVMVVVAAAYRRRAKPRAEAEIRAYKEKWG
jgi:hypothetical protein